MITFWWSNMVNPIAVIYEKAENSNRKYKRPIGPDTSIEDETTFIQ